MNQHSRCERCGDSMVLAETATRAFCASCASIASTGARGSSELLFTLSPAVGERTTAEDLASFVRPRGERISITPLLAFGSVAPLAPPRARSRAAASLLVTTAVLLAGSTVALAWHVAGRAAPGTPSAQPATEAPQKAQQLAVAPPRGEALAPPLPPEVPVAELAPRPESIAPETIDPRPAARTPRASAPRVAAPPPRAEDEDLLGDLFGQPRAPAATSTAPRVPARRDVSLAMRALEDEVAMCGEDTGAMVTARVTFVGSSGRVAHAEVVDATVPPEVRSCIARAVRAAELPEFAQDRFTVAYPFRL